MTWIPLQRKRRLGGGLAGGLILFLATMVTAENWPAWRGGAAGSGVTSEEALPLEWDAKTHIRWRVRLPDRGNATPVVWEDRIFVPQAVAKDHFRSLMCFRRKDGSLAWQKGVVYDAPEQTHRSNPYCSGSAVTDGERVIVSFGSAGVHCYDFEGKQLWQRDLGSQEHEWGHASSPVLHGNFCLVYHGPGPDAALYGLDKKSGEVVWKWKEPKWDATGRVDGFKGRGNEGIIGSFSTPIVIRAGGRDELVMSFPLEVRAFDPATGRELWRCAGLNPLVYTSPIYGDGVVVAMGGYQGNSLAVRPGGNGDVTGTHRVWHTVRDKGGIGTGVIHDGHVYYLNSSNLAACLDLKTGAVVWEERLPAAGPKSSSWSSFLRSDDRIYSMNQSGDVTVFRARPKFEVLESNALGQPSNASIAASRGELFLRTDEALWCIAQPPKQAAR